MEIRKLIGALVPSELGVPNLDLLECLDIESFQLFLWGFPERQENDAEGALAWALTNLPREARAHVGEFRIQTEGRKILGTDDGFSPHLLLSKLEPGDLSVDPDLAKIYNRLFLFEEIEEENLFLLRGRRRRPARIRGLTSRHAKLIGRESEKKEFQELLEQISEDQGQVLGIVGDAGIGKTRLVEDLMEEAQKKDIPILHASYPIGTKEPYVAFRKIVRDLAQNDARTLSRWNVKELEIDFLRLLLEPDKKIDTLENLSDAEIKSGLFRATKRLVHASSKIPRVIFIDDLHWAQPEDFKLIENLLEGIEQTRLLFVLVHRPIENNLPWTKRLNYNELTLEAFNDEEVRAFLKENLQVDRISKQDLEELLQLSLGSPLFLEEIVRKLRDENLIEVERLSDGKRLLRLQETLKASRLPRTIAGILDASFDRLDPTSRKALQWLAIFGPSFDMDEAESFFDQIRLSRDEIRRAEELGYTFEKSVFPSRIHAFAHDLVFETIRETIPRKVLEEMNAELALFLEKRVSGSGRGEVQRLADLFLTSTEKEKAFQWSLKAGKDLLERSNFSSALFYLENAFSLSVHTTISKDDQNDLFFSFASALIDRSEFKRARSILDEWKNSPLQKTLLECRIENGESNHTKVIESTSEIFLRRKEYGNEESILLEILVERILALFHTGQMTQCREEGERILSEFSPKEYPEIHFRILGRLSYTIYAAGDYEEGLRYLGRAEKVLDRAMTPKERIWLLKYYGNAYWEGKRFPEAIRFHSESITIQEEIGLSSQLAWSYVQRAELHIDAGNFQQAFEDCRKVGLLLERKPDHVLEGKLAMIELDLHVEMGNLKEIEKKINEIDSNFAPFSNPGIQATLLVLKGFFEIMRGRGSDFIRCFEEASHIYWKQDTPMKAARVECRLILMKCIHGLDAPSALQNSFEDIRKRTENIRTPNTRTTFWYTEVAVASFHSEMKVNLEEYDIDSILPLWSRMEAFKAFLLFYSFQKRSQEYAEIFRKYSELHERRKSQIPEEFMKNFENHPLFAPQAIERLIQKGQN